MGGTSVDRTDDLIHINIRNHAALFVSRSRLCSVSRHFRELLTSDPSSGGTKELNMLDDDPHVWKWFQTWLRLGALRASYDLTRSGWVNFLTLYFFAEEKAVLQLQNQLMDVMASLIQRVAPNPEMVNRIWSKTGPRSALRGLIIEGFVYEFHAATVLRYHNYDNTQFLQDLIHYYQDISAPITNQARKPFMVPCRYHVHEAGDPPHLQAHNRFARAKFGMLKSDGPPGPMVADSRFDGTEHFGYTGTIPSLSDTIPGSNLPRQPMVANESESHFSGTDNTRNIPFINIIDAESNTPRPPMIEEEFESLFNGTGQFDNLGTTSIPDTGPESNVPRGPIVEEKPGSHFKGTGQFDTPRSIPSNPDAWNPGCDRQMC